MKRYIIYTSLLLILASRITAQTVISANGGTTTTAGTQVSWTIGEPVIATVSDANNMLTQGFQQSKLTVTAINEVQVSGVKIKVYPNPTANFVTVHFSKILENLEYLLFDLSGKLLEQKGIESSDTKIEMAKYSSDSFILKLNNGQLPLQTFKIVKR